MNYPKYFGIFLWLWFSSGFVIAQTDNYVLMTDASGFDRSQYEEELEAAATALVTLLPTEIQSDFKIYDFGFYLHSRVFEGGTPDVFQEVIAQIGSFGISNYFLIGKQYGIDGKIEMIHTAFSMPAHSSCYDENIISDELRSRINGYLVVRGEVNLKAIMKYAVNSFEDLILKQYYCCPEDLENKTSRNLTECPSDDNSVAETSSLEMEPKYHVDCGGKIYLAPTGYPIFLPEETKHIDFFGYPAEGSTSVFPLGAIYAFWIGDKRYRAYTDSETKTIFMGFKDDNGKDYDFKGISQELFESGQEIGVWVSTSYEQEICSRKVLKFKYSIPYTYEDPDMNGGVGEAKTNSLDLNYTIPYLIDVHGQSSANVTVSYIEAIRYFGQNAIDVEFFSLNYKDITGFPCPKIDITAADLNNLKVNDFEIFDNGSFIHRSPEGNFYWQIDEIGDYYTYYLDPRKREWILFTPKPHPLFIPEDVFYAMLEAMQFVLYNSGEIASELADQKHVILTVIGASDIPIVSQIADVLDAGFYLVENNPGEAAMSVIGVIPLVSIVGVGAKYSIKFAKNVKKYSQSLRSFTDVTQNVRNLEQRIESLNLSQASATRLKNLMEQSKSFNDYLIDVPQKLDAWKILDDADVVFDPAVEASIKRIDDLHADLIANPGRFSDYMKSSPGAGRAWDLISKSGDEIVQGYKTDTDILSRLNKDLVESPTLSNFIDHNPNGFYAWKFADDAYPNRPWCTLN